MTKVCKQTAAKASLQALCTLSGQTRGVNVSVGPCPTFLVSLLQAGFHPAQGPQPTLPAAPPYPARHDQEQTSRIHKADGVPNICTSEGRDDVRGTGEGKWLPASPA